MQFHVKVSSQCLILFRPIRVIFIRRARKLIGWLSGLRFQIKRILLESDWYYI